MLGFAGMAPALASDGSMLLHVSTENSRYFAKADGAIVYLQGAYYGCEFKDHCFGGLHASDFSAHLALMAANAQNLLRFWTTEDTSDGSFPQPYARSDSACCAQDGENKWDLNRFDVGNLTTPNLNSPHYFERMRARVTTARAHGIYVSIMLWHSFGWENGGRIDNNFSWDYHPFKLSNNVNSVDGDANADGMGEEFGTIQSYLSYQEAYVRQIIAAVGDLDNVLYEICNECLFSNNTAWQKHMIDLVHREDTPFKHPVIMSAQTPNDDDALAESGADAIVPARPFFETDPPKARGTQVSFRTWIMFNPARGPTIQNGPGMRSHEDTTSGISTALRMVCRP